MRSDTPQAKGQNRAAPIRGRTFPIAGAAFWAIVAAVSLAAFKLSQVRMQPDAIATGIPGILFRLVVRPLEMGAPLLLSLPAVPILLAMTFAAGLWGLLYQHRAHAMSAAVETGVRRSTGGDSEVPGRRETI